MFFIDTKLEIKTEVDLHMTYLKSIHYEGQALKALMKERKDLIQVMEIGIFMRLFYILFILNCLSLEND